MRRSLLGPRAARESPAWRCLRADGPARPTPARWPQRVSSSFTPEGAGRGLTRVGPVWHRYRGLAGPGSITGSGAITAPPQPRPKAEVERCTRRGSTRLFQPSGRGHRSTGPRVAADAGVVRRGRRGASDTHEPGCVGGLGREARAGGRASSEPVNQPRGDRPPRSAPRLRPGRGHPPAVAPPGAPWLPGRGSGRFAPRSGRCRARPRHRAPRAHAPGPALLSGRGR